MYILKINLLEMQKREKQKKPQNIRRVIYICKQHFKQAKSVMRTFMCVLLSYT